MWVCGRKNSQKLAHLTPLFFCWFCFCFLFWSMNETTKHAEPSTPTPPPSTPFVKKSDEEPPSSEIAVRLVWLDHYMTQPHPSLDVAYSTLHGTTIDTVPVLRIFGSTANGGQKACVHVHKVFPYFFIKLERRIESEAELGSYLRELAMDIDRSMNSSVPRSMKPERTGGLGSKVVSFVHDIIVVKGNPFYGFAPTSEAFLKILLYNPQHVQRLMKLFWEGMVTGQKVQAYEAHIPFGLQFMMDFRLYGMGWLNVRKSLFRTPVMPLPAKAGGSAYFRPLPRKKKVAQVSKSFSQGDKLPSSSPEGSSGGSSGEGSSLSPQEAKRALWGDSRIQDGGLTSPLDRMTTCELEIDVCGEDIMNVFDHPNDFADSSPNPDEEGTKPRCQLITSLAEIWEEERARKILVGDKSSLTPPPSPPRCTEKKEPFYRENEELIVKLHQLIRKDKMKLQQSQENAPPQSYFEPNEEGEKEGSTLKLTQTDSRFLVRANTQFEEEVRTSCFPQTQGGTELPLSNNPFALCNQTKEGFSVGENRADGGGAVHSDEEWGDFDNSLLADLDAASFLGELQAKSDVSSLSGDLSPNLDSSRRQSSTNRGSNLSQRERSKDVKRSESGEEEEIEGIVELSGVVLSEEEMDCDEEIPKHISNVPLESETNSDAWSSFEDQDFYSSPSHNRKRSKEVLLSQFKEEVAELTQQISQVQQLAKERDFHLSQPGLTQELTQQESPGCLNEEVESREGNREPPDEASEGMWKGKEGNQVRSLFSSVFRNRDEGDSSVDHDRGKMKVSSIGLLDPTLGLSSMDSSGPLADPLRHLVGKLPTALLPLSDNRLGRYTDQTKQEGTPEGGESGVEPVGDDSAGREVSVVDIGSNGSEVEGGRSKMSDETILVDIPQSDGHYDQGRKKADYLRRCGDWVLRPSRSTGRSYWQNQVTLENRWDIPPEVRERDERKEREKEREQEKKRDEEKEKKRKKEREREKARARDKERERKKEKEKEREMKKEREKEKARRAMKEKERAREKSLEKEKDDRNRGKRKEKGREKIDRKRTRGEPHRVEPKRRKVDPRVGIEDIDVFPSASLRFSTPYSLDISSFPSPQDREPSELSSPRGVSALDYVVKEGTSKSEMDVEVPRNIQAQDFVNASGVRGVLVYRRSDKRPRVPRSVTWDRDLGPTTDESDFEPPPPSPHPSGFSSHHPVPLSPHLSPEHSLSLSLLAKPQPTDVNSHSPSPVFPSPPELVCDPPSIDLESSSSVDLSRIGGSESFLLSPSQSDVITHGPLVSSTPSEGPPKQRAFSPRDPPPTTKELLETLPNYSLPPVLYEEPFYEQDEVEATPPEGGKVVIGCMEYDVEVKRVDRLPDFWEKLGQSYPNIQQPFWLTSEPLPTVTPKHKPNRLTSLLKGWSMSKSPRAFTRVQPPPSLEMVMSWEDEKFRKQLEKRPSSPVLSPTPKTSSSPRKARQLPPGAFVSPSKQERNRNSPESREESYKKLVDFFSNLNAEGERKKEEKPKKEEKEEGNQKKGEGGGRGNQKDPKTKKEKKKEISEKRKVQSQIEGPSLSSPDFAFSISQTAKKTCEKYINQNLTVMCLEIHALTKGELLPNPSTDSISCVTYCVRDDDRIQAGGEQDVGVILVQGVVPEGILDRPLYHRSASGLMVTIVNSEQALFQEVIYLIRDFYDVDILCSFDVESLGLGFLCERAAFLSPEINLCRSLSRFPCHSDRVSKIDEQLEDENFGGKGRGRRGETISGRHKGTQINITGRLVLDIWKLLRIEITTTIYSFNALVFHVNHIRVPSFSYSSLTSWWEEGVLASEKERMRDWERLSLKALVHKGQWRVIESVLQRSTLSLGMLTKLDIISKISEHARVFGIEFQSVISRASQYRVEAMMLRVTKPLNYILLSPTRDQVAGQRAPECFALTMEPESRYYTSPVVVLDFRSLYPSIMIAYNYCYSTCLGKVDGKRKKKFGVTDLEVPDGLFGLLGEDRTFLAPNNVAYVTKDVRVGVLPRLLSEILETRFMVKKAMKGLSEEEKSLKRVLDSRQRALKMVANVTYGYTGASFSGRMPCADVADSIVETARRILEASIRLVEAEEKWGATVVYGDTDSIFVHLPGRSREEAFQIGKEISRRVTELNPAPIMLQFEKVYHPCLLVSKKRYVGMKYEYANQVHGVYDAKGIETVRRDTCPAVQKIEEKCLRILFETQNLTEIRKYLWRQWDKILNHRVSLKDFIFAKEVRLGTYRSLPPPAALVAMKKMALDPRSEPHYGQRVPYVVVAGTTQSRLCDLVVDPEAMVSSSQALRLNMNYYIRKQILPALSRLLNLVGADVDRWFAVMPRNLKLTTKQRVQNSELRKTKTKRTIDEYYGAMDCLVCSQEALPQKSLCEKCFASPQAAALVVMTHIKELGEKRMKLEAICGGCVAGRGDSALFIRDEQGLGRGREGVGGESCTSIDCEVFFQRKKNHNLLLSMRCLEVDLLW